MDDVSSRVEPKNPIIWRREPTMMCLMRRELWLAAAMLIIGTSEAIVPAVASAGDERQTRAVVPHAR